MIFFLHKIKCSYNREKDGITRIIAPITNSWPERPQGSPGSLLPHQAIYKTILNPRSIPLYLNDDREDERLAVECFENMSFGNVADDSPEVYPICDTPFLRGKHFFEFFV